jgi:hypothetical protein
MLDAGYWMLDTGYWILDSGFWMLDSGYWILDTGYWILDAGFWMLDAWCVLRIGGYRAWRAVQRLIGLNKLIELIGLNRLDLPNLPPSHLLIFLPSVLLPSHLPTFELSSLSFELSHPCL